MTTSSNYDLFPEIQSFHHNWLQVDTIHRIYFEECGNPDGCPVVFLHGGPGSGCNSNQRRFFDPEHYRIILLDQRGCGRSTPEGEINNNTTAHLVNDIDALRSHLGISKWHVFGGSWGSTLALAYALDHADKVISLTLRGIFLSRTTELHWFLSDVKRFYPEPWEKLCDYLAEDNQGDVLTAYEKLVFSEDNNVSIPAAIAWNAFENSIMSLLPSSNNQQEINGKVELARARVQIHYIKHQCFIGQRDMLAEATMRLPHIPTVIVQGRYDMVCPPLTAWELKTAMPHAQFVMVPDAGHSAMEKGTRSALIAATEQFKSI
ncbi:MAG: prolyl aminopeptidase [Methylophilus sp.]